MSNITDYAKKLSPSLYKQLKQAVETGKWLDGNPLTEQQKEEMLQLTLVYQSLHNDNPEHFTIDKTGKIFMEKKSVLQKQFSDCEDDIHKVDLL